MSKLKFSLTSFRTYIYFFIVTLRTLLTKTKQTLLTIPLTIRYLDNLLYDTSLEYNYCTNFLQFVCFFRLHTYVLSKLQFRTGLHWASSILLLLYLPAMWRSVSYFLLVYTTQVNSTFRARWLASPEVISPEVISQVLFTSEQPRKNKIAFVALFSQIKFLFGPLVIQLVWYILKQLFTSVSVKVVDIYLATSRLGEYPPLFTSTLVNNC